MLDIQPRDGVPGLLGHDVQLISGGREAPMYLGMWVFVFSFYLEVATSVSAPALHPEGHPV